MKPVYKHSSIFVIAAFMLCFTSFLHISAQTVDRSFIKQEIESHNSCRNAAITEENGNLVIFGKNGWAARGCPKKLTDVLSRLNEAEESINEIQITEGGRWLIIYGDNGFSWNNLPKSLGDTLVVWNDAKEVVTSVSFNDKGDWIAVSKNHVSASDSEIEDWMKEGMEEYGAVTATCITDKARVIIYERGSKVSGTIPEALKEAIDSADFTVQRLKISGDAWFISDGRRTCKFEF